MKTTEKVAYLKGLAEGLGIDDQTKEGKVIAAIIDALDDLAHDIESLDDELDEVAEVIGTISDEMDDIEDEVFGEDECDCEDCCDDEDMYEVTCPSCNNSITVDYDVISSGEIVCPNCGEKLEFDLSDLDDEDEDDE